MDEDEKEENYKQVFNDLLKFLFIENKWFIYIYIYIDIYIV